MFSHKFDQLFASDDNTQAVMIGSYDLDVEKAGVTAQGTYLFVMERDGDGWNIVADMFNQHAAESGAGDLRCRVLPPAPQIQF